MIKRYCDCCDEEITDANNIGDLCRLQGSVYKEGELLLQVEVITAKGSVWNDGDFCKYCIIDAINEADDRPKNAN